MFYFEREKRKEEGRLLTKTKTKKHQFSIFINQKHVNEIALMVDGKWLTAKLTIHYEPIELTTLTVHIHSSMSPVLIPMLPHTPLLCPLLKHLHWQLTQLRKGKVLHRSESCSRSSKWCDWNPWLDFSIHFCWFDSIVYAVCNRSVSCSTLMWKR